MELATFRDSDEGCSALVRSEMLQKWFCGGSLGQAFEMDSQSFESREYNAGNEPITAMAVSDVGALMAHAVGDSVSLRSLHDLDRVKEQRVVRRTLPISHLEFSVNGQLLLISSQEQGIDFYSVALGKVVDRINTGDVGVRFFSLSDDMEHLAILDLNGTLTIYRLHLRSDGDPARPITRKDLISLHVHFFDKSLLRDFHVGCSLCWLPIPGAPHPRLLCPSADCITVLTATGEDKWTESYILPPSQTGAIYNVLALSPNRSYLAACTTEGSVSIWKLSETLEDSSCLVTKAVHDSALYSLAWGTQKTDNYLLLLTHTSWGKWDNVVANGASPVLLPTSSAAAQTTSSSIPSNHGRDSAATVLDFEEVEISDEMLLAAEAAATSTSIRTTETALVASEEQQSLTQLVSSPVRSPSAPPAASRKRLQKTSFADLADVDTDLFAEPPAAKATSVTNPTTASRVASTDNVKTKALFSDEAEDESHGEYDSDHEVMDEDDELDGVATGVNAAIGTVMQPSQVTAICQALEAKRLAKFQPAFQPSSTRPDEKNRKYLAWNHVGNITLREESLESRVEVRFTNSTINRNEAFPDRTGYVMAALSYEGAIFATEAEVVEEKEFEVSAKKGRGSVLHYRAFSGKHLQGANESFSWTLAVNESALALAAGKGWAAVATSKQYLRIFSSTGTEIGLSWLPGPVVCMSGCEEKLCVVYHTGRMVHDTAVLEMLVMEIDWMAGLRPKSLTTVSVPLSTQSTLQWLGFDIDQGLVCTMDSSGVLSMLMRGVGWQWMPVLEVHEVRKSIDHKYWPITVRGDKLVYVLLNGESKPSVHPQPVVSTRPLRLSVCPQIDGRELNDATREKHHRLLWEDVKTSHLEHLVQQAASQSVAMDLSKLEEKLEAQSAEVDNAIVKMLQQACKEQQIALAISLGMRLRTTRAIDVAITVANHFGRAQVAQTLDKLLQYKMYMQRLASSTSSAYMGGTQLPASGSGEHYTGDVYDLPPTQEGIAYDLGDSSQTSGVLSKKAAKQIVPTSTKTIKPVSPATETSTSQPSQRLDGVNPFALNKTGNTPVKRKSVLEGVQDLKETPSPKKPALSRLSTFSQTARTQRLNDKNML